MCVRSRNIISFIGDVKIKQAVCHSYDKRNKRGVNKQTFIATNTHAS